MTMSRTTAVLVSVLVFTMSIPILGAIPAFPGAEGFGAKTIGGRGGRVVEVTNLNDAGTGSLRDALTVQTGPRIVIFRVSGTIAASSNIAIREANSFVTIAGQTSPGGVQIKGGGIHVSDGGHDVIVRYMRLRPGAIPDPASPGSFKNQDTNAFIAYGNNGKRVYNIIIDHCSLQWSTDQNGPDAWGYVTDYTAQWNLTAEGTTVGNWKGSHNTGLIVGASPNITYSLHHSLLAHCHGRNPLISQSGIMDFRNNVVYNWLGNNGLSFGNWMFESSAPRWCPNDTCGTSAFGNIVNNLYLPGPNYNLTTTFWINNTGDSNGKRVDGGIADRGGTKVYTSGNWSPKCPSGCSNDWDNGYMSYETVPGNDTVFQQVFTPASKARALAPFMAPAVTTDPTDKLRDKVLATVGASKPKRDAVDTRIINDVINRTGGYSLTAQYAGGPWPDLAAGAPNPPADTDHDGMPDAWETAHGFNPNSATDGSQDKDGDGYTNVEEYLNELAGDPGTTSISLMTRDDIVTGTLSALPIGSGKVHISWIGEPNASVTVYTLAGKQAAFIGHIGPNGAFWDAKQSPAGVYLVRVKTGNAAQVAKVFHGN